MQVSFSPRLAAHQTTASVSLSPAVRRTPVLPALLLRPSRVLPPSAFFQIQQQACLPAPPVRGLRHSARYQAAAPISPCFPCGGPSLARCQTASPVPRPALKMAAHPPHETASAPLHQIWPPVARAACHQILVR